MTKAEHKALVARYLEQVLTRGDVAALDDLLAPEFRSWLPDGTSVGPGPYRDAVLASRRAFPDLGVTVLDQVAEGDKVATRWRAQGTHRGLFAGVAPPRGAAPDSADPHHSGGGGRRAAPGGALNLLPLLRQLGAIG